MSYRRLETNTQLIFNSTDQFSREKYINLLTSEGEIIGFPKFW